MAIGASPDRPLELRVLVLELKSAIGAALDVLPLARHISQIGDMRF
jgi:hypothetical protein